jgi:membrane-bound lytic murein transglycosylase F
VNPYVHPMTLRRILRAAGFGAALVLSACSGPEASFTGANLEDIREAGELVVVTAPGPTSYSLNEAGEPVGYEVELAQSFADHLGVPVRFELRDNLRGVLAAIADGEGHIAAAGITRTDIRQDFYTFGPSYKTVREQVVCRRFGARVREPGDLASVDLAVVGGSSYEETLRSLKEEHPEISWRPVEAPSAMPLLEQVQNEQLDCTVADSTLVAHARLSFPELLAPLDLASERSLAWITAPETPELMGALEAWFADIHGGELLAELDERWYGHTRRFDYVDTARFVRRIDERLPALRRHFIAAARETGIDWRWLAAQAYQESHWDPDAVSATGVRGVMMLTLPTANELGIEDRTDPAQSIDGGARYLRNLYDRLPEEVTGDDRLFKAFAAYNIGMGHLYDARRLALRQGMDANVWPVMRETLPMLTEPTHYETVRYGYARGHEPVQYVRNIRRYRVLLDLHLDRIGPEAARANPVRIEDTIDG